MRNNLKSNYGLTTSPASIVHDRTKSNKDSTSVNNPLVNKRWSKRQKN